MQVDAVDGDDAMQDVVGDTATGTGDGGIRKSASSSSNVEWNGEPPPALDVGEEARPAKAMPDPGMPTEAERKKHRLTHMPYRAWCPQCVQGRGRDIYHGRIKEKSRVARICMDFMFLTERGITTDEMEVERAEECITFVVLKE